MESPSRSHILHLHDILRRSLSTAIIDASQKYCRKMDVKFRYWQYWLRSVPCWNKTESSSVHVYLNTAARRFIRDQTVPILEKHRRSKAETKLIALPHELLNSCFRESRALHSKRNAHPRIISRILPELQHLLPKTSGWLTSLSKWSSYRIH